MEKGFHWRRLDKNIGWANQNIEGEKVVKIDKCMGDSQLLGDTCPGCPLSLRLLGFFYKDGAIGLHVGKCVVIVIDLSCIGLGLIII